MTQICVPLMVEDHDEVLRDAIMAAELGADLVEYRVDVYFEDKDESTDLLQDRIDRVLDIVKASPLPCIVTCRPHWEGGEYHGDDDERVALYEALGTSEHPPAYIDVELATYTRSANIRQKINLAVNHPEQVRSVSTRLILSTHDFSGRPTDLTRKILEMQDEPACSIVKIAYRARSIRDNLELFEILADRQKPTIALCMGEFGIMSRILAPKFGGFLTFASLRDESTTAPGQITIDELLNLYRFRSINPSTKVYGIIGWPVTQSMSPMVHNAGFEQVGWDGVYVPMPVEESYESFKATMLAMIDSALNFTGASVTIPHKDHLGRFSVEFNPDDKSNNTICMCNNGNIPQNTFEIDGHTGSMPMGETENTDADAVAELLETHIGELDAKKIAIVGSGGVAMSTALIAMKLGADVYIRNRTEERAKTLVSRLEQIQENAPDGHGIHGSASTVSTHNPEVIGADAYINCTPVGMTDGPNPDGLSIPIPDMDKLAPKTVFFDTVYNPIETPMIKAAKERGFRTIDGVQMFVKQAEAQFEIWTGQRAPEGVFDSLVRSKLSP
jgi:3-dehydroquinate dehydratase/shikimate dehydrogenase